MTRNSSPSTWLRRLGLGLATLVLLALILGLALQLSGRARLGNAVAEYERQLGEKPVVDLSRFERPMPPEHLNAAVWLQAGAEGLVWSPAEEQLVKQAAHLRREEWGPELERQVRSVLERNRAALSMLHRAADLEAANYGILYRHGIGLEIPNLLDDLAAAFLLNVEARLAFEGGDPEGGRRAARALARLTTALDGEQVFIFSLVAIACEKMLVGVLLESARSPDAWAADPDLLDALAVTLPARDPLARARQLPALDASALAAAARYGYREAGQGPIRPAWGTRYFLGPWVAAELLSAGRQAATLTDHPYPAARERLESLSDPRLLDRWSVLDVDGKYRDNLFDAVARFQKIAAQRQLARAALALRGLALRNGGYPATRPPLAELGEPDPFTGRHLAYEIRDDGSSRIALDGSLEMARELLRDPKHPLEPFHEVLLPAVPPPASG